MALTYLTDGNTMCKYVVTLFPKTLILIHIPDIFRTYSCPVQDMLRASSGHIQDMSGHIQDTFETCSGHVHDIFKTCSGHIQDMFRTCSGSGFRPPKVPPRNFLEPPRKFLEVTTGVLRTSHIFIISLCFSMFSGFFQRAPQKLLRTPQRAEPDF